ncbi:MAG TPA: LLM class flavin-dependent oxidoreductase [Vicinamibacterales bacterium]|nr:LLM class flavin-dependent oxidoreductase [Vicinamibacterales bacterium]
MVPRSVLDLATITQGSDAATALRHSLDLAQHAERWGYYRYWLAEHHNMPGIASAATSVVIAHVAAGTKTIRVGAGGIMLPNHAPLIVAEQFGTLEALFPGRIDLGLGRAPGSDHATARALRRTLASDPDAFPQDVLELLSYFEPRRDDDQPGTVRAVPGAGLKVPLYILGSSLFGAQVAAALGLPFAFASHFAAPMMLPAIEVYRRNYRPSPDHPRPYLILGVNVVAADTDGEARWLATSGRQAFASLRRGMPTTLPPPSREFEREVVPFGTIPLEEVQSVSMVGSAGTVREGLEAFVERTHPDEVIVVAQIYDHAARLRSFEIVAAV